MPIPQEIDDISSSSQLLSYALAGQLDRLKRQGVSQTKVARAAFGGAPRAAAPRVSRALQQGPTFEDLRKLDEIIGALAPEGHGTGGLSSLALRVSGERHATADSWAHVPSRWTAGILDEHPGGELGVLVQASALLSAFTAADKVDQGRSIESIRDRYRPQMELLVDRLVLLAAGPPTSRNYEAQVMLGTLARYDFEWMRGCLGKAVRDSPLSFRVWRPITKLVKLSRSGDPNAGELRNWVRQLLRDSGELRKDSLYAGRSHDLELALAVPAEWSPAGADWAGDVLLSRARNEEATIRERGTAAMGLWQRAIEQGRDLEATEEDLRALITEFRDPESRPDAAAGLRWVAATLERVIDSGKPVCNGWPEVNDPWFRNVKQAAAELDHCGLPGHLVTGTKNLFLNMILQNAGAYRRHAVETAAVSGWSRQVAEALSFLLKNEQEEAWVRIRAEYALSILQRPNQWVEGDLEKACKVAYKNMQRDTPAGGKAPPRARITEVHMSLFAVGDCFGVPGAEEPAKRIRNNLSPILTEIAGTDALMLRRTARAAAYMLIVTAQPRENGEEDLSEVLLKKLSAHSDRVTQKLSSWALSFRFAPDGSIRPLLDAADHGDRHDAS